MDATATGQDGGGRRYTTAQRVQVWFLGRSRDNWKRKYQRLKAEAKRLQNRANDAARSRERWRERAEALAAEVAALRQGAAGEKKGGPGGRAAVRGP